MTDQDWTGMEWTLQSGVPPLGAGATVPVASVSGAERMGILMIEMRAVRVLDGLEIVVKCVHDVATQEGHLLAHTTAHLETGGGPEVVQVLSDLYSGLLFSAERGRLEWSDDCGW